MTHNYAIADTKKVPIIKNLLGRDEPQFIETLTTEQQGHAIVVQGYSNHLTKTLSCNTMKQLYHYDSANY